MGVGRAGGGVRAKLEKVFTLIPEAREFRAPPIRVIARGGSEVMSSPWKRIVPVSGLSECHHYELRRGGDQA